MVSKGLAILKSIATSGLLLTPERTVWSEFRQDGTRSEPIEVFQKRACFTELAPDELQAHGEQFGSFAIEFEIEKLRLLGAIPVFYLPAPGSEEKALGGVAAAFVARMEETQRVLSRIADLQHLVATAPNKSEMINVTLNGKPAGTTRCTITGLEDILTILLHQTRPAEELLNAFRAIAGFFYPTEDMKYTGELAYYRQREWRIISAMVHRGREISSKLYESEASMLIDLDHDFFDRVIRFPSGEHRRIDQCMYLREVDGRPFLSWARRVIVPDEAIPAAKEVLRAATISVEVAGLSEL